MFGSDLASMATTAIRDGDRYIVNGSKTFITNGINADLVITVDDRHPRIAKATPDGYTLGVMLTGVSLSPDGGL